MSPSTRLSKLDVAVTGAAGYLGRALCRRLAADSRFGTVLALDRQTWSPPAGVQARQLDINDPALAETLQGADVLFHLAFVLGSVGSAEQARRVNLDGTRNVCEAAGQAGLRTLIVSSSVSAYGALVDNPMRLRESDPLRAGPGFRYAHHKAEVERILDRFEAAHPELRIVRQRIATVVGPPPRPGMVTQILRLPVLPLPHSFRAQFVHVDDAAEALVLAALHEQARGAYNIAAEPCLDSRALAAATGQRHVPLPGVLFALLSAAAHRAGLKDPDRIDFLRHPIVVDGSRAREELGWQPEHDGAACLRALEDPLANASRFKS